MFKICLLAMAALDKSFGEKTPWYPRWCKRDNSVAVEGTVEQNRRTEADNITCNIVN
jgi:hypothetical protein